MRRRFYIDPEIQFPLIASLILLATLEGLLVGWGFYKAILIARDWQRPHQALDFFAVLSMTILPVVLANFAFGTYLSNKIAGPLNRIRQAITEIARGNLEGNVSIRSSDMLQSCAAELNQTMQTLKRLIYRDYHYAIEVNDLLSEIQKWISEHKEIEADERKRLEKLLKEAKSRLSIINTHFVKGKTEKS